MFPLKSRPMNSRNDIEEPHCIEGTSLIRRHRYSEDTQQGFVLKNNLVETERKSRSIGIFVLDAFSCKEVDLRVDMTK